jgi:hypothetical protein
MSDLDFEEEIRKRREARKRKSAQIQAEYEKNQAYQRDVDKQNE